MRVLRICWWWALDLLYATAWQVRSLGPTTADDYRSGTGQPVVVIPGIYETWHFMRPLMDALHDRGHPVYVISSLRHNLLSVPNAAAMLIDVLDQEDLDGVIVVAHSKGGLIGKYAMTRLDPSGTRIDRLVAVSTPFGGSSLARIAPVRQLRAFRVTDPVIAALLLEVDVNARVTSVAARFDPLVPNGSALPGATNVRIPTGGHFRVLADRRAVRAVIDATG